MEWYSYAIIPLVIFTMWLYTAHLSQGFPTLHHKRIAFLIAHPDDEAMFFAPSVIALTKPELGNHVTILCLSSGNADGLGEVRKKELEKSAIHLGLHSASDISIIEDKNFPDSMTTTWSAKAISDLLTSKYLPSPTSKTARTSAAPTTNIDMLITFDAHGISSHPNHIALYRGAHVFQQSLAQRFPGWEKPITLYTLRTTWLLQKYLAVLDAPATILRVIFSRKETGEAPTPLFFVSGTREYAMARRAMTTAHTSQMVWFRWGWIALSRYMYMNDLRREGR